MAKHAPLVVAHRGDSEEYPENTLLSFDAAVRGGAHLVELDFHETSDGALVCTHDEELDRTTNSKDVLGRAKVDVAGATLADVKRLDAGRWKSPRFAGTGVPVLAEALSMIQKSSITMVEHKKGDPAKLAKILREMDLVESVLVQSFDWDWLERIHALEPRLAIAALGGKELTPERLESVRRTGACMVHWNARDLRAGDVPRLHALGYLVCIFTVDDDLSFIGAAAAGVDAITTNRPGRLKELVAAGVVRRPGKQ
jgi:glycerophosphoryl diester phosphodiesterase